MVKMEATSDLNSVVVQSNLASTNVDLMTDSFVPKFLRLLANQGWFA